MKTAPKRRLMTPNEVAHHEASAEKAALDKKLAEQDARDKMEAAKAAMQELEKKKDLADNAATTAAQAKEAAAQTAAEKAAIERLASDKAMWGSGVPLAPSTIPTAEEDAASAPEEEDTEAADGDGAEI